MKLNINFNKKIEPLINSSEALSNWFEKNQETMAYFEMTRPGCLHFENTCANLDVKVLGRMASSCLTWLQTPHKISDASKVGNAVISMVEIYENQKEFLTDTAKDLYYISDEEFIKEEENVKSR